jgi:type II secretory pathway pseudopilin PulG
MNHKHFIYKTRNPGFSPANSSASGFTLIELILYVSVVSFVLSALMIFALNIISSTAKSNTQQGLYATARLISERINFEIRDASAVTSVTASTLTLASATPANNPTVIDFASGAIRVKEGTGAVLPLNGTDTTVTSFAFTNYTSADGKAEHVGYTMTIETSYAGARKDYKDTVTLESSAEVRSN